MKGIFSYDSPLMQILAYIGDLIILNFIYLLCCAPIFTIGAAQAGMYTAMRVLNDKEDDTSVVAAFFRGFKNGFLKVTLAWGALMGLMVIVAYASVAAKAMALPTWICLVPVCICALFVSQVPAFHSRFDCTPIQLIRNSWFLIVAHPLRSIGNALLIWLPVIALYHLNLIVLIGVAPLWATLYYAAAFLFGELLLRKPFKTLVEDFNARNAPADTLNGQDDTEDAEKNKIFHDTP